MVLAFQEILKMLDNLIKFKYVLKMISTNFTNFDKFIQSIKILAVPANFLLPENVYLGNDYTNTMLQKA